MKRFRFSLQPVAVLRAHRELKAREAFGAAVQAFVEAEDALAKVRARVATFEAALSAGRSGSFSAAYEANALVAYRQEREAELASERKVTAAQAAMQERRIEYLDAHRRLEVVKRLEEKARTAHRAAVGREEQAEFDEFASRRATSRRSLFSP